MRIAAVDLITNTCFPVLAADELGLFKAEGLDVEIELIPALQSTRALRSGVVDLMAAGSIYDILTEFPEWSGAKVVVALSQGTPWLLVVRSNLTAERGDISAVKGLRITAAEGPDQAFKQMLIRAGIDPARDLDIVELTGARARDVSFGVFAAQALADGKGRRILGQRHGRRDRREPRGRKSPHRCTARRRSGRRSPFHVRRDGDD